jgi:hypothetical protein
MQTCPACHRHVRTSEVACPFCRTGLRAAPAPLPRLASMVLAVGLSLAGCIDEGSDDEGTEMETETETTNAQPETGGTETTTTMGTDSTTETTANSGETYAGPDPGDWTDTGTPDGGETGSSTSDTSSDGSTSDTGSESDTGSTSDTSG